VTVTSSWIALPTTPELALPVNPGVALVTVELCPSAPHPRFAVWLLPSPSYFTVHR
jgi:hypothetical protein